MNRYVTEGVGAAKIDLSLRSVTQGVRVKKAVFSVMYLKNGPLFATKKLQQRNITNKYHYCIFIKIFLSGILARSVISVSHCKRVSISAFEFFFIHFNLIALPNSMKFLKITNLPNYCQPLKLTDIRLTLFCSC